MARRTGAQSLGKAGPNSFLRCRQQLTPPTHRGLWPLLSSHDPDFFLPFLISHPLLSFWYFSPNPYTESLNCLVNAAQVFCLCLSSFQTRLNRLFIFCKLRYRPHETLRLAGRRRGCLIRAELGGREPCRERGAGLCTALRLIRVSCKTFKSDLKKKINERGN